MNRIKGFISSEAVDATVENARNFNGAKFIHWGPLLCIPSILILFKKFVKRDECTSIRMNLGLLKNG